MQKELRTAVRTVMTKLMTDFQFTFMMINFECLMLIFSHTDLTDLTDSFSLQATVLTLPHSKNSEGVKIREIREIRVGKNQH